MIGKLKKKELKYSKCEQRESRRDLASNGCEEGGGKTGGGKLKNKINRENKGIWLLEEEKQERKRNKQKQTKIIPN